MHQPQPAAIREALLWALAGLALWLIGAWALTGALPLEAPDTGGYREAGKDLINGQWHPWRPPAYPWLLQASNALFASEKPVLYFQAFCWMVQCGLFGHLLARYTASLKMRGLLGGLYMFSPGMISAGYWLLAEAPLLLCLQLGVWGLLVTPNQSKWSMAWLAMTTASLFKPVFFYPALMLLPLVAWTVFKKKMARFPAMAGLVIMLVYPAGIYL